MERRKEQTDKIDPNLDTPSVANTQKHINFLEEESERTDNNKKRDDFSDERRKQWEEGLAKGKEDRENK